MRADGDAPPPDPASKPQAPPDLGEALHALGADSRAGLKAASDSLKALRILVAADFSLARSAFTSSGRMVAMRQGILMLAVPAPSGITSSKRADTRLPNWVIWMAVAKSRSWQGPVSSSR